jgi:Raf kinase inhibitor-like YbhB/YbcL family protein
LLQNPIIGHISFDISHLVIWLRVELKRTIIVLTVALLVLCSCQNGKQNRPTTNAESGRMQNANAQIGKDNMVLTISSTAFSNGGMIPAQYTCDGPDISPPLQWSGLPPGTKTLALIVDDPDAPAKTWVHWVVYDLPGSASGLPENIGPQEKLPGGGKQGTNDFKKIGYGGPCPPSGTHRYFFKLYALDTATSLKPGASKDELLKAIEGHVVAQGELVGKYKRQRQ